MSATSPTNLGAINANPPAVLIGDKVALDKLEPMLCALVVAINADGEDSDRLKAMGLCVGRRVEVTKQGDPLILRVFGSRIGISSRLAKDVVVQACERPECQPGAPATRPG